MRLLLVEDDREIAHGLTNALRRSGHAVDWVGRCADAVTAIGTQQYELVVLDLGLPDADGLTLLRALRARNDPLPVLILTARDALPSRVQGLDLGADDYVLKPFDYPELEARIRAVARRTVSGRAVEVRVGRLTLKPAERGIFLDDVMLELSPREFGVLETLMLRSGRVVSKAQIQAHICDWHDELADSAIELYVHRVRRKLESAGVEIRTVRGFGYLLEPARGG